MGRGFARPTINTCRQRWASQSLDPPYKSNARACYDNRIVELNAGRTTMERFAILIGVLLCGLGLLGYFAPDVRW